MISFVSRAGVRGHCAASLLVFVLLTAFFAGCAAGYDPGSYIGKTSAEITEEYGSFDCVLMPADEDGLYRNCRCGYTIKEPRKGFFGKTEEVLLFIVFDDSGVAVSCEEGYRPGG